ncbi:SOS response-associated peptidase [Nakamurella flavida]|uniref:Abasic site processing protein n=1 Tax=Nakamurella flavida TaxID=363630 RepID=A0A938YG12_9ACTN|nr:SOS response-associated peptidase [Nakamurella flavida]MBM9477005.1 SOS response-associated peptidase [Nakamurella flavida]MDP9779950.1 putative SOS response-associated peptidase YedK [Nakamurella flavida]
MCGRYALTMEPESLYGLFGAVPDDRSGGPGGLYGGDPVRPRYNIAPTVTIPVVRLRRAAESADGDQEVVREIEPMRWGLVPSWAKDLSVGNRMFNARAESVADKPAFRRALERRRCLVPASGYYEWRKTDVAATAGGRKKVVKQPFYLTPADGSVMAFAGLWEYWKPAGSGDDDPGVVSMTILTTEAVGELASIHDRMPLVLPASEWAAWLDPAVDPRPLLTPPTPELVAALELRPVGPEVGNVANDRPELAERVDPDDPAEPETTTGTLFDNPA